MQPPPPLHASVPGSFARNTLAVRIPAMLTDIRRRLPRTTAAIEGRLEALAEELRAGPIRGLEEQAPDRAFWDEAVAPNLGHHWLDVTWFFGETYFYRRLLEATGYFGDGALAGYDPYSSHKAEEWQPHEGPRRLADILAAAPDDAGERLRSLLYASLWGNRADLSYNVAQQLGAYVGTSADVLVDDSAAIVAFFAARPRARVVLVADNAGTELLMDLALCDHLLATAGVRRIDMHVKNHPTFISDTIAADVDAALRSLDTAGALAMALAARLRRWRAEQRLVISTHPFYTTCLHFPALPADLRADCAGADLVITKGDANYRRLCSDAPWPVETPFAAVVEYFPAPLVALRILKAEVVVGLPPGTATRLAASEHDWMVNGRRGLVQGRL